MSNQFKTIFTGAIAALVLTVSGCGQEPEESTNGDRVVGVDLQSKTLFVGALNDESGPGAAIGRPYAVGKRILAAQVNAGDSGILPTGWKVKMVERDHSYNPQRSVQLFNEIRDSVLFIATSFGTPNTLPLRPMLKRHGIVAFPASLSSKMAENEYTPPIGASYRIEAMRAMDWVVASTGDVSAIKAGIVYQQDDYGQDGFDGWHAAAKLHGVKVVASEAYAPGQVDFTAIITSLKKAGATHVLLTTLPSATVPVLGAADQLGFKPVWVGNTPAWIDRFFDKKVVPPEIFAKYHQVSGGAYYGEAVPIMSEFADAYNKFADTDLKPDFYMAASYIQGRLALQAFADALENGDVSRNGYLLALRNIKGYDGGGAYPEPLDFTRLPYVTSVQSRILRPNFKTGSWDIISGWDVPARGYGN